MRFLLVFLLAACSAQSSSIHADLAKLRPWSADVQSLQPLPPPYVADFEAGAKALSFLALDASTEKDSPGLALVRGVMGARAAKVVVLEGIPRGLGVNPVLSAAGATGEAIALAAAKKIPYVGAEPAEELVLEVATRAGFTTADLFGFAVLRKIPEWRRDGTLVRATFAEVFAEERGALAKRLGMSATPSQGEFEAWYASRQGKPFQLREVRADTTAPVQGAELFTQRLAAVTDRVRSEHILRVTEEMLNKYGKVLLVFPSAHFPVQQPALESMLGKPVRISDSP